MYATSQTNCWGKPITTIFKADDALKCPPNPLKLLPHKAPHKAPTKVPNKKKPTQKETQKETQKVEKNVQVKDKLRPNGYLGTNYTVTKTQEEVLDTTHYGAYTRSYKYDDGCDEYDDYNDYEDSYDHTITVITEEHTIIRSDICDWLKSLIANNSPFAIVKTKNGSLSYIKTHERPPTEWTGTKVQSYKFPNDVPSFKKFTQNIFAMFPFLLESNMFPSFLNKQDLKSFVCVCKRINKAFGEFYKTRDWTIAPEYNRFAYKVNVEKNDTSSNLYYEKLPNNRFTIKETLWGSSPEYEFCDMEGFCDENGRHYPCLFINKK